MMRWRPGAVCVLVLATVAGVSACSAPSPSPGQTGEQGTDSRFAEGVAVLGDSISTAKNSDPARPEQDSRENSWATGTSAQVQSIYSRLVAVDPAARGHAVNLAVDDSGIDGVIEQARRLVQHPRDRELVLLQGVSEHILCDGTDATEIGAYAGKVGQLLDVLTKGLREPDIVLISQLGTAQTFAAAMSQVDPTAITGVGPCDPIDPGTGRLAPDRIAHAGSLVAAYEAKTAAVCAAHPHCRTDGYAARRMPLSPADFVPSDLHLSLHGERGLAAAVWPALYPGTG